MDEFTPPPAVPVAPIAPKTSGLAIAAFVMGLASLCGLWPILALPALICGIVALVKISQSSGALTGKGFAITGIVIPGLLLLMMPILMAILLPALSKVRNIAQRVVCETNIKGISAALVVYANEYDGILPPGDNWCDLLTAEMDCSPKSFICPSHGIAEGQSSYALNRHAAGQRIDRLPPQMVLVFETSSGTGLQWNLVGEAKDLCIDHHREGCNILFVDGHTEFVPADQLDTLRWTHD